MEYFIQLYYIPVLIFLLKVDAKFNFTGDLMMILDTGLLFGPPCTRQPSPCAEKNNVGPITVPTQPNPTLGQLRLRYTTTTSVELLFNSLCSQKQAGIDKS